MIFSISLAVVGCAQPRMRFPVGGEIECVRGIPQAMLLNRTTHVKTLQFNSLNQQLAVEKARLIGNIRLTIEHHGCDQVSHTFRFYLPHPGKPVTDHSHWYHQAANLLNYLRGSVSSNHILDVMMKKLRAIAITAPVYGTKIELTEFETMRVWVNEAEGQRLVIIKLSLHV